LTPPQNILEFCEYGAGLTCPSATFGETTTAPTSLNADMATIISSSSSSPSWLGINSGYDQLYGIAFSGITNSDIEVIGTPGFKGSGFTGRSALTSGAYASIPLPYRRSYPNEPAANDPDIAVGTSINNKHFALIVYEINGDIFLEHYEILLGGAPLVQTRPY